MQFLNKISKLVSLPIFRNWKFILFSWVAVGFIGGLIKYLHHAYKNYETFTISYNDALQGLSLYPPYEDPSHGMFHYGPTFTALIAPFANIPDAIGLPLWMMIGAFAVWFAVRKLDLGAQRTALVSWFCVNELFTAVAMQQFNIYIAAIIILTFVMIESRRDFWAALFIMIGTFTKIYGIVGFAFFFFSKNKPRLILSSIFWAAVLFVIPMIYTSSDYVISQYSDWFANLASKNGENMFSTHQNISFLGMVRKATMDPNYSDLWLIAPSLLLFALPYLRVNQYKFKGFREMMLASVLLFTVLYSTGSESSTYIIALLGVAIWYVVTPSKTKRLNLWLMIFVFIFSSLLPTDLFPRVIRNNYMVIKAIPCFLVWLKISYELCCLDFSNSKSDKIDAEEAQKRVYKSLDIVLPCYNPSDNWVGVVIDNFNTIRAKYKELQIGIIICNDGSKVNVDSSHIEKLKAEITPLTFIDQPTNQGKGSAVRAAAKLSSADMVMYTDIDFPYTQDSIYAVIDNILNSRCDIAIGVRNTTYYSKLSIKRKILSRCAQIMNLILLNMDNRDAQGGLKAFNSKGKHYLLNTKIDRYMFDTEFISKASRDTSIKIDNVEVNLRKSIQFSSMSGRVMMQELGNFAKIIFS